MQDAASTHPLIVALHGGGVDGRLWELVAQRLPDVELLAPDLVPIAIEAEVRAERLLELLAAKIPGGREAVVTGCSVGSVLACGLAAKLGQRTRGLLVLAPGPVDADQDFAEKIGGLSELLGTEATPELADAILPIMASPFGPYAAEAIPRLRRMLPSNLGPSARPLMDVAAGMKPAAEYLAEVRCPVRTMFGALDTFPSANWIESWRQRLGRENVTVLAGSCHQLPLERPDAVAEALSELLATAPDAKTV